MLQAINTWSDYRTTMREFDAVLEHGKAVCAALTGTATAAPHTGYGEQIFAKLLGHSIALRRLAPDPAQTMPLELWDLPSMSALARCVIETHDAFEYIAGHAVTEDERGFRIRLWELHDASRRMKMLSEIDAADPLIEPIRTDAQRLQSGLEGHALFAALSPALQAELRRRFSKGDPPAFHLNQRQRCAMSGVNADWHNTVTMQLAHHAHTLPYSVAQLREFRAGTPQALGLVALPLVFTLPFLTRAIQAAVQLMPGPTPVPPSRTTRTMAAWRAVAEQGPVAAPAH